MVSSFVPDPRLVCIFIAKCMNSIEQSVSGVARETSLELRRRRIVVERSRKISI